MDRERALKFSDALFLYRNLVKVPVLLLFSCLLNVFRKIRIRQAYVSDPAAIKSAMLSPNQRYVPWHARASEYRDAFLKGRGG